MKRFTFFLVILTITIAGKYAAGQNQKGNFKKEGNNSLVLNLNQQFTQSSEIYPFQNIKDNIYGMDLKANIKLKNEESLVQVILVDKNFEEYLIYETYSLLESKQTFTINDICEETGIMNGVTPYSLKVVINDAEIKIHSIAYSTNIDSGLNIDKIKKEKKVGQNAEKIEKINNNLKQKGLYWVAGPTPVSELSYSEKKMLFGQSTFPAGMEYYAGGVMSSGDVLKSATSSSPMTDGWDWRNRHGKNWVTPVTNQKTCGSCWAFASTGATEALVNLFFNQLLNLDLSEQDVLSCSGAGSCNGGYPSTALDYIASKGIVDEAAFPYSSSDQSCFNKSTNPKEQIKIGGRIDFGSTLYPRSDDNLKRMIIEMGPLSGGLSDWSHAMVLVGYQVVKEGDVFYYRDLNLSRYWRTIQAGDPLIGKTVWIFKNSWGALWGDYGYIYVETPITNIRWTHGLKTPVVSVKNNYQVICEDRDGDGYYWWGIGSKPASCPDCPDLADGDDSNPNLGPLDEFGNCIILDGKKPAPVANFTGTPTAIITGNTISITDLSENNPQSWQWSFPGGSPHSSTTKNPAVTYNTAGTYNITLTVTNANGEDTETKTGYITVTAPELKPPVTEFTASKTSVIVGESIQFTDLSTNNPQSWQWSFPGGSPQSSTAKNPAVTYNTAGTYNITLTVTNADGDDTKTKTGYITVTVPELKPPVTEFTASKISVIVGESIQFTDLSVNNPQSWQWSFPGASTLSSTARNPAITYNTAGTYNVTLTVANADGEDTKTQTGYITVTAPELKPPIAEFTANITSILVGESIQFTDLSVNNPQSWQWSFTGSLPQGSTDKNPAITYSVAGTYNVTLTVANADGNDTETKSGYITVNDPAPLEYCTPFTINNKTAFIQSIVIGNTINNIKGTGYRLIPEPLTMETSVYYSISLVPGSVRDRNFWRIWIDLNGDMDFDDAGETLIQINNKKGTVKTGFSIPQTNIGTTRIRIAMRKEAAPSPCDDGYIGEVIDFTVNLGSSMPQMASNFNSEENILQNPFEYKIYPNPVQNELKLIINNQSEEFIYSVYNLLGEKVITGKVNSVTTEINVSELNKGMFLLVVSNDKNSIQEKFVKH